ncbi:hypothetical protein WN943_024840 [Citrus x changshan-huyou]
MQLPKFFIDWLYAQTANQNKKKGCDMTLLPVIPVMEFKSIFEDYTVYMEERRYDEPQLVQDSHHQILSDILGCHKHGFSGFAAVLTVSSQVNCRCYNITLPWSVLYQIGHSFPSDLGSSISSNSTLVSKGFGYRMGQAFYNGKEDLNKFYPIVIGKDIAAYDADEGSASHSLRGQLQLLHELYWILGVLPDIAAPGLLSQPLGHRFQLLNKLSCHSELHTSPAAIKSAIVTTASLKDEYAQSIVAEGAPHKHYGGGHVNPNKAVDPGLAYGKEATNVSPVNSGRTARVQAPAGTTVRVEPSIFNSTGKNLKF